MITREPRHRFVGSTLRALRESAGVSLRELARRIGVSAGYLSQVESGQSGPPTPERLFQIAAALGLDEGDLAPLADRLDDDLATFLVSRPDIVELVATLRELEPGPDQVEGLTARLRRELNEGPRADDGPAAEPSLTLPLTPELVLFHPRRARLKTLIAAMVDRLEEAQPGRTREPSDRERLVEQCAGRAPVLARDVALPHARLPGFGEAAMVVALAERRIALADPDPSRARLFLLLIGDEQDNGSMTRLIAELARRMQSEQARTEALEARNHTALLKALGVT